MRFSLKIDGHDQVLGTADLAPPLSNRRDISNMPAGDQPVHRDDDAKRGWPKADGGRGLTPDEKVLARSRWVGAGTDNVELPSPADRVAPDGTPIRAREPRAPREPRQPVLRTSPAVERITAFLNRHHIDDQTATPASSYRFAVKILRGQIDGTSIVSDFINLLNDPTIVQLVKRDTIDTIKHPTGIMNEAKYSDEEVVHTITFIYWALTIRRYIEAGQTSTPQYIEVKNTLLKVGNALIKDGGWNRQFNSAVAQLERQAQNTAHQAASDPGSEIQQLRKQMTPANRREFDEQMRGDIENGESPEVILRTAREYAAMNECRILRGILT
jgi:hypothetical protein